jgi:DNA-binding transcriptional LysR family regulator
VRFDLRDIEIFIAVAEAGSIARAADRLHTVASAVSKRIADLEGVFGTLLLVRGAKGVELTAIGNAFLARARVLLQQANQLDREVQQYASGSQGHVRLFANMSAVVQFLPAALASFGVRHPDIHVHVEEHVSSAVAAGIANQAADFGIVSELPLLSRLVAVPFRADELVLVLPADHALAGEPCLSFAQVATMPLVGLHADSSLHHLLTRAASELGTVLQWRIHVASFDAACSMVGAGLGFSVVPRSASVPYARTQTIAAVPLSDAWSCRQLYLCRHADVPLDGAAQMLFDHLLPPG